MSVIRSAILGTQDDTTIDTTVQEAKCEMFWSTFGYRNRHLHLTAFGAMQVSGEGCLA